MFVEVLRCSWKQVVGLVFESLAPGCPFTTNREPACFQRTSMPAKGYYVVGGASGTLSSTSSARVLAAVTALLNVPKAAVTESAAASSSGETLS